MVRLEPNEAETVSQEMRSGGSLFQILGPMNKNACQWNVIWGGQGKQKLMNTMDGVVAIPAAYKSCFFTTREDDNDDDEWMPQSVSHRALANFVCVIALCMALLALDSLLNKINKFTCNSCCKLIWTLYNFGVLLLFFCDYGNKFTATSLLKACVLLCFQCQFYRRATQELCLVVPGIVLRMSLYAVLMEMTRQL